MQMHPKFKIIKMCNAQLFSSDWLHETRQFQKNIYKVSVFKIHILRFPLILAGSWNMGDMKVETLLIFFGIDCIVLLWL